MSRIAAIFSTAGPAGDIAIRGLLAAIEARGGDHAETWAEDGAALAVSRHEWEFGDGFAGPVGVARDDACVVVADATLYYRDDLRRRLAAKGVSPQGSTPSHLILAAYRAWGERCAERLEGDFAFILWDRVAKQAFCSRDFGGKRPLFYAELGNTLVVASTVSAVIAHPACPDDLDLASIAATAAGLFSSAGPDTCYRAVRVLPAAHDLSWRSGALRGPARHWDPATAARSDRLPFDAAADELRDLLGQAVAERLAPSGPTTIWMSGGWDSTAVFGAGQQTLRGKTEQQLRPVSISYPPGDPGREDELITAIAEFWKVPAHWLDADRIPLFDPRAECAAIRDEPFTHLYELWNRALASGSRARGSRVALDGNGGDQLFQLSDIFLSDLFRRGRWISLAREWRAKGGTGIRNLISWVIQPALPPPLLHAAATLRGHRPPRHYLDRPLPSWIAPEFLERHGVLERERLHLPSPRTASRADAERDWYLTCAFFPRGFSAITAGSLEEGVELRSPLLDRRVVDFALSRPRTELSSGRETKRLLRHAMRGLLPDRVLAPRPFRTGITTGYSTRGMLEIYPAVFDELFRSPLLLAELGILDPGALRRSVSAFLDRGRGGSRVSLFHTLQTELWLRARLRPQLLSPAAIRVTGCSGQLPESSATRSQ